MSSRRDTFANLVDQLAGQGLSQDHLHSLHGLRLLYNRSKHEPGAEFSVKESQDMIAAAQRALCELTTLGIGVSTSQHSPALRHHLWVGFWDHYTWGSTEAAIMLPSDHWTHVGTVDVIHLRAMLWDALKAELIAHPRFHLGEAHFVPEVWASFCREGDFLNAGVWDGDYGEIVRLLVPYEFREINDQLLPGLSRTDQYISVGAAVIMSLVDIARAASAPLDADELAGLILKRASEEYALSIDAPHVRTAARQVSDLVAGVPFGDWTHLSGPALVAGTVSTARTLDRPLRVRMEDAVIVLEHGG